MLVSRSDHEHVAGRRRGRVSPTRSGYQPQVRRGPEYTAAVRTHPETGKLGLYIHSAFIRPDSLFDGLTGQPLDKNESRELVRELTVQHTRMEYNCRFTWQRGSIAFWDNRAVQHYAASDYYPHRRVLRRVTISGDKPY